MQDPLLQIYVAGHCADVVQGAQTPFSQRLVGHWKLSVQGISVQTPVIQMPFAHSSCHVQETREDVEKKERALDPSPEISPPSSPVMLPSELSEFPTLRADELSDTQRIQGRVAVVSHDRFCKAQYPSPPIRHSLPRHSLYTMTDEDDRELVRDDELREEPELREELLREDPDERDEDDEQSHGNCSQSPADEDDLEEERLEPLEGSTMTEREEELDLEDPEERDVEDPDEREVELPEERDVELPDEREVELPEEREVPDD